jgi:PAS domain S-box-containing protein
VLVAVALIGNALISLRDTRALVAGSAAALQSRQVMYAVDDLLSTLKDAETGQRGYLLTHDAAYLDPYRSAVRVAGEKISALKELLTSSPEQLRRLTQLEPLIAAKLDELRRTLELYDSGDAVAATALVATDRGKHVMDDIRERINVMRATERALQTAQEEHAAQLYSDSQYTRVLGMCIGLVLVALVAVLLRRDLNARQRAARAIFAQREWYSTVLRSIGDAVIVTDPKGSITLLNPVAESLTGWSMQSALGKPLLDVFDIISESTRERAEDPVARALAEGKIVGLANHTILRARDEQEYVIEDSAAPVFDQRGAILGAVMVFHDRTQRRKAEIALSTASREIARRAHAALASERTLNTILENAPIGISMTGPGPDFPIIAMSRQMHEWLGPGENQPPHTLYRKLRLDGSVPPAAQLPLNRAMYEGIAVRDEAWIVDRPQRPPLRVVVNVAPVRDADGDIVGAVHSWVDLTDRERLDRGLHVTQSRLRVLIEADVIGLILSLDRTGRVTDANRALLTMLGFSEQDLSEGNINLAALTPAEYRALDEIAFDKLTAQGHCTPYEKEFTRKDGARISVIVGYARVYETADEFVGFALDVTERKQLEERLREQAEQLRVADRRKDEFLAMLAHELRNPLAPLRNAVYLLEADGGRKGSTVESVLPTMRRQIDQLVRMVDDLLDAARISHNKIVLERNVLDLRLSVRAAVETIEHLFQARDHKVEVQLPTHPVYVNGDDARLIQTFANILHNAAKYTESGGRIRISLACEGNFAIVRIRDSGQGIAAEFLPRIFDPFTQADQSLARSAGGLGVGLALVRRLSELHDGEARATSAGPGKGSEFEVRLPLVEAPVLSSSTTQAPAVAVDHSSLRVLVVDDNRDVASSTAALLKLWGHEAHMLHNGNDVLTSALGLRPNVILLDIGLPEMDGFEVARRIRREPGLDSVRLIAMTGYGQDRDRQLSREAGFDAHLIKPVQPDMLKTIIEAR